MPPWFKEDQGNSDNGRVMRRPAILFVIVAIVLAGGRGTGAAATSGTVVGATVPSATDLDLTLCASGTPRTLIGTVLPGSDAMTAIDCVIDFGSSNDRASLYLSQRDRDGVAMYRRNDGSLDTAFGTNGMTVTSATGASYGGAALVDSLGRIVIAGGIDAATTSSAGAVFRYLADGTLDPAFGVAGVRTAPSGGTVGWHLYSAAFASNGDIYATGYHDSNSQFRVIRLNSSGSLVGAFGTSGTASLACTSRCWATALDVGPDDLPVVVGQDRYSGNGSSNGDGRIRVMRLLANGNPDPSFGAGGSMFIDPLARREMGTGVIIDDTGRIYVVGFQATTATEFDLLVTRLAPSGAIDTTYGTAGTTTIVLSMPDDHNTTEESSTPVAFAANGDLLVAATSGRPDIASATSALNVIRLDSSGAIRTTFGASGFATTIGQAGTIPRHVGGMVVDDEDGIVLSASVDGQLALVRFTDAGAVDSTFGTGGVSLTTSGDELYDGWYGQGIARRADGKLVVAGSRVLGGDDDPAVISFGGGSLPDLAPGSVDWAAGTSFFGTCLIAVTGAAQSDGGTWPTTGSCPMSGGDPWRGIPASTGVSAHVAHTLGSGDGTANLRFGTRMAASQRPGTYIAPITATVVAPGV
jgi:uncharacterized delta-60 repeat protein